MNFDDEKIAWPVLLGRSPKPNAFEDRADFGGSAARSTCLRRAVRRFRTTSLTLTRINIEAYVDADERLVDFSARLPKTTPTVDSPTFSARSPKRKRSTQRTEPRRRRFLNSPAAPPPRVAVDFARHSDSIRAALFVSYPFRRGATFSESDSTNRIRANGDVRRFVAAPLARFFSRVGFACDKRRFSDPNRRSRRRRRKFSTFFASPV